MGAQSSMGDNDLREGSQVQSPTDASSAHSHSDDEMLAGGPVRSSYGVDEMLIGSDADIQMGSSVQRSREYHERDSSVGLDNEVRRGPTSMPSIGNSVPRFSTTAVERHVRR